MRILALEPYYSGSHRAFLDGWRRHSRHEWTLLTLPGYKWKWRMRHAPFTFADEILARFRSGERWDILFATDMLDLAALRGLAADAVASLPSVVYFHENQLTYPVRRPEERDFHFALTNLSTAACADRVWFNSEFHRASFLDEADRFLRRMPDYAPLSWLDSIPQKSTIYPQGIDTPPPRPPRPDSPLRILWAARWEFDKNPEDFFATLRQLRARGFAFRLSVIGEQFADSPSVFESARVEFADRIDHWGFLPYRAEYWQCLSSADIIVSTAHHEFFGVTVVEAAAAGVFPLLPHRLAYPEIFPPAHFGAFYYGDKPDSLVDTLSAASERLHHTGSVWPSPAPPVNDTIPPFYWSNLAQKLDSALDSVLPTCPHPSK